MHIKKYMKSVILIVCLLLLSACINNTNMEKSDNEYDIYYLNSQKTALISKRYELESSPENFDKLVSEIMEKFMSIPSDIDASPVIEDNIEYQNYTRNDNIIYVNFSGNYINMKPTREILVRLALAKTLSQIEGINFIGIYAGGQPIADNLGQPIPIFSESDFIDTITDINTLDETEIVLYFSNESGTALVEEKRKVIHNINTSLERLVIEELIKGPKVENNKATIASNTKLININTDDGTCYLNFNTDFLNPVTDVEAEISIYSLVNSLSELNNISKVQINVNGSNNINFRDELNLKDVFERNLDYIEEQKEN